MRRLAAVAFLLLALALAYRFLANPETGTGNLSLAAPEPNVGSSVSNFKARDTDGGTFELTDKGVYVLAFWSTLNRNSNQARPRFIGLAREYGDEASFAVVYVNGALEDEDAPYDRLHDPTGTLASRYNVKRVPRHFVIRDGEISYTLDTYGSNYEKVLRQEINAALEEPAGRPPQTASKKD